MVTDLYQLMKDLKIPASDSKIFITPRSKNSEITSVYQLELDLDEQTE